jgi:chloramphenicol O-acetyltransferase type A
MKTKIDTQNWPRKEHYKYFGSFDDPFFGIVVDVDCTVAYQKCKEQNWSFFLYYMYESIKAVNLVENFRYRIIDGEVWIFDRVHASTTVGRKDGSFGFGFFEYTNDFAEFAEKAKAEIEEVQKCSGLRLNDNATRLDVIHNTTIPWFSFKSIKHEKSFSTDESIPKIAFGKFYLAGDKKFLPVSVNANHGLLDAYHISKYLEYFQEGLNKGL